jgi:phage FluMu protein Com
MLLKEYHCKICGKLLCKGNLTDRNNVLEIKCKGCHKVCFFSGEDADIIRKRSVLISKGLIADPEREIEKKKIK